MVNPLLEVVDLSFTHIGKSHPTVVGANLVIAPGEWVLLAGATGSGKSTLLSCIAGILPTQAGGTLTGQIRYDGQDIREWSIRQRSHQFCILRQNVETQMFTDRVWDEVVFGLENWNVDPHQIPTLVESSLQEFGLLQNRHWPLNQLSAGQKQRLLLACLVSLGQPLLILDEPFAFLDQQGVDRLLQILQTKKQRGQSILIIEHRLELLQGVCDRIYTLQNGTLSLAASPLPSTTPPRPIPAPLLPPSSLLLLQTRSLSWNGYPPYPDLTVVAGETVLLQGDNGCGKTTLLKLCSGLLKPTSGLLDILGRDVRQYRGVELAKVVGFVLQNPNHQLFADSVRQEVEQPGVTPREADSLLERLNLQTLADYHPHALSQGQKRRLALGAVLARRPKICLLDEIMVGQDPTSLALMLTVLAEFTAQGGTLIFTSHDPQVATVLNARIVAIAPNG